MIHERYSTVWQECGSNSQIASRFYVPGYTGYLPFFLWGDELAAFEGKKKVELREEHLLKGILYGLFEFDRSPKPWHRKEDRETLLHLLDVLGSGFNFKSPEQLILDVAYSIAEKNGSSASRIVLEVGAALVPSSDKIKSDLICSLWAVISENESKDSLYEEIIELVKQTKLDEIHPDAKEVICFYGFCATVFLKREDELKDYLMKYIYPNVTLAKLKHSIKALLENPDAFSPAELRMA